MVYGVTWMPICRESNPSPCSSITILVKGTELRKNFGNCDWHEGSKWKIVVFEKKLRFLSFNSIIIFLFIFQFFLQFIQFFRFVFYEFSFGWKRTVNHIFSKKEVLWKIPSWKYIVRKSPFQRNGYSHSHSPKTIITNLKFRAASADTIQSAHPRRYANEATSIFIWIYGVVNAYMYLSVIISQCITTNLWL